MNPIHEANRKGWDAASPHWQARVEATIDWRRCATDPSLALEKQELRWLVDVSGKGACVLGSGDNLVVFALAGMGAKVTSVDISQVQLDIAARRASELVLDITFVRADLTDLHEIPDATFDLVYTGGHVAVWVSDLRKYYSEAGRILKRGGLFMVNEYHPFRRIWRDSLDHLELEFQYLERAGRRYDRAEDIPGAEPGSLPSYEFHWTVSDFVAAMLDAGCVLLTLDEFGNEKKAWEAAPIQGLPENLLLVGRKL